jgi:hypothetical protein
MSASFLHLVEGGIMADGFVHTVYRDGRWINEVEGVERASSTHDTKDEAVRAGRDLARSKKTEHVIHNLDGKIGERHSYGNDPARRLG